MHSKTLAALIVAALLSLTLFTASSAMQDDGLLIVIPNHVTGQSRWAWEVDSDHPDALHFGMSITPHNNSYCPPGDTSKDVVYQIGMNASGNGATRTDPAFGAVTLNWESNWCNTAGVRMSEWQLRAIGEANVRAPGDTGRVRFIHTEFTPSTGYMVNRVYGDYLTFGQWGKANTAEVNAGRWRFNGSAGFWGSYGPSVKPTVDLATVDACTLARVLASYGMVTITGSCPVQ